MGQPFRKRDFIDFHPTPFDSLAAFAPAIWRPGVSGAAIHARSFFVLHDHRTPRFTINPGAMRLTTV